MALALAFSSLSYAWGARAADVGHGGEVFHACAACHSLEPGRNLTGPSLSGIWGRKAGSLPSFHRYSPALKGSDVVWNAATLDAWLKDPASFIPGNSMPFPGIRDETARADLIAYLKDASSRDSHGRNVGARRMPDLKKLEPDSLVTEITYCGDTYRITTADGKTYPVWEFNLRFKTDSTDRGPRLGNPALMGAAMRGDRAFVIFSSPAEITAFIKRRC